MKEVLSLATFALGVLCLVAFVTTVKPTTMRSCCGGAPSGRRTATSAFCES
jgi:hypothetical protein